MIRKGITLGIILLFLTTSGSISIPSPLEKSNSIDLDNKTCSHTIFAEFGATLQCVYCKYTDDALMHLFFKYRSEWQKYPFYYITHIWDVNVHAKGRCRTELGMDATPSVYWDGGWRKNEHPGIINTSVAIERYRKSIRKCASRSVADIDLTIDGSWLGAVNENVTFEIENGSLICILQWTNSEMVVNVTATNNEASSYNGHLHVYVCDNQSSMGWYDRNDTLFMMAFLDYVINKDISINSGSTWENSTNWDGMDHTNGTHFYENITESNTWIVASLFNRDNNNYSDETAGYRLEEGTDPKIFTVYFGDSTPPPLAIENTSTISYKSDELDFNTTYYWRVDVWNNKGERRKGDILYFTVRDNNPPNTPSNPFPSINSTICPVNFSWKGGDPDGDNVTYDLYFGEYNPPSYNLSLLASNISKTWYQDTRLLEFSTWYSWMVVTYDEFGYNTSGPIWIFETDDNLPPYKPRNPYPKNNEHFIPINVTLCWIGGDPLPCDVVTYDVYFGVNPDPQLMISGLNQNCTKPPYPLVINEIYYWRVVTWDSGGLSTSGPIWSFSTGYPIPPDIEIINPQFGYIHLFGNPLFPTPFNIIADTITIGGFKSQPIQINVSDDNLSAILLINDEYQDPGTWNPKTGYYEWYWTERAFGTYIIKAMIKDPYGLERFKTIKVWCFCP